MKALLIGGGEIGRRNTPYETETIDHEIVSMTGKDHPNFLFVGLASSFADSYYDTIKKIYQKLGCNTVYLKKNNLIHNPSLVHQKFLDADIIYVGGGDTIKLMEKIEEYHLKDYFVEACNHGCVLAGISAGAIMIANEGFSDSLILRGESDHFSFVSGLGLYDISISPHYHADSNKTKELEETIKNTSKVVYGIENGCAIKIDGNKMSVVSAFTSAKVYELSYLDKFIEKEI